MKNEAMLSLVIPIYKNEENLDRLLDAMTDLARRTSTRLEAIFVVDGSPDRCHQILRERLPGTLFDSRLVLLSRNFGSFAAIAAGLEAGGGDYFAVLAADLQDPPDLILQFQDALERDEADIVFGCRASRSDPWLSELFSRLFWHIYRAFVVKEMPKGGVDVFGCTRQVRDRLLRFKELNTNLIALLFWLGFRRKYISYHRRPRREGVSSWTFSKKLHYCLDSIFNFTDLPIQLLLYAGIAGITISVVFAAVLIVAKLRGAIPVPGYTPIVLAIMFFGGLSSLGLGIVGQYLWLCLQNTRNRPPFIIASEETFQTTRSGARQG